MQTSNLSDIHMLIVISIPSFHEYTLLIPKPIQLTFNNEIIRAYCTIGHHIIIVIKNIHRLCVPTAEFDYRSILYIRYHQEIHILNLNTPFSTTSSPKHLQDIVHTFVQVKENREQ